MWLRECTECGRDFMSSDSVEKPLLCYYCFEDYKKDLLRKQEDKIMDGGDSTESY